MDKNNFFEQEYMPRMHRIGKIVGLLGVAASFLPAIVLAVVYGLLPKPAALLTASLSALSAFGLLWIFEPISYFSVLGPIGTYMAFLSGNISNMRVPCASMAQVSAEVQPGTEKGSIIATIGMAVSVIINISVLTIGVILGSSVLNMLPPQVTESLNYLLPALFGALLIQFGIKTKSLTAGIFVFGVLLNIAISSGLFKWLPGSSNYLAILSCVFLSIGITLSRQKKQPKQS